MTVSGLPPRSPRRRKATEHVVPVESASRELLGLVDFLAAAKPSVHKLLSTTSPAISLLGGRNGRQGLPAGLTHLRAAVQGDWQPYLHWLLPQIRAESSDVVSFDAWNHALSRIRVQMLTRTTHDRLEPACIESIMLGLEEVLGRVADAIWDVYSASGAGETQQAQAAQAEELQRAGMFRVSLEGSAAGMLLLDETGIIQLASVEAARIFGYASEELVGLQVDNLVPLHYRPGHASLRDGFMHHPFSRTMGAGRDMMGRHKDGSEVPIEVTLQPVSSTGGGHLVIAVIVDITRRLQWLQEIADRTEELRRSNQELEQFAYVASHDLQEPLRTVVNFTELFSERYGDRLDERGERYVKHIVEGSKRMQALVRALLAYSRVSSQGKEPVAVDSQAILKAVCDSMRATIQHTNAEITWGDMPVVIADDVQLAQIFLNLIGNAIKFCDNGRPRVRISARREGNTWVFAVQDNGIGIEAEHSGRLFQMFQRLQPRGQYEGSGIGLALTKRIIERHGGRIWFKSEPGKGSTFYVTLKATESESTDD